MSFGGAVGGAVAACSSGNREYPETFLDPINPKCLNCNHILSLHKIKGCTNSAFMKGHYHCGCKHFSLNKEEYEKEIYQSINSWKEWFNNSEKDQMIIKEKIPLVQKRLRKFEESAIQKTKEADG